MTRKIEDVRKPVNEEDGVIFGMSRDKTHRNRVMRVRLNKKNEA